jgi:hypothetical protein
MPTASSQPQLAPYLTAQRSSRTVALLIMTVLLGPAALILGSIVYGIARLVNRSWLWITLGVLLISGLLWASWHWQTIRADGLALWEAVRPVSQALQRSLAGLRSPSAARPAVAWWPLLTDVGWGIVGVWRWGLLGLPLVALYLNGTRLRTAAEQEAQRIQTRTQALRARSQAAARRSVGAPLVYRNQLVLGATVAGDLPWVRGSWVVYPEDVLGRHLVLIGASGMGKSETALRLAAGAARAYGWQIFFLDAKGDRAMADRFWAAMHTTGTQRLAMLPQRAYDGWRGDATALLNRLLSIVDFSEPFYRDLTKMVLSLAIDAPQGPPRASRELLNRLRLDALRELYAGHLDERDLAGPKSEHVAATYNRYRAFFRALHGHLDGDWAWEDMDAAYLLLDGLALKDQAVSLGRYLLEDFAHYVAVRKDPQRHVLLIVDEFSALAIGGTDAASLFERVRSYGASVVVTSQSYAGLGVGADRILGATAAVLLHQCADPEPLIARAGMIETIQQRRMGTEQLGVGGVRAYATGQVSFQEHDVYKIQPSAIQRLGSGEAALIAGGAVQQLRVSQLALSDTDVVAAQAQIAAQQAGGQRHHSPVPRRVVRQHEDAAPVHTTVVSAQTGSGERGQPPRGTDTKPASAEVAQIHTAMGSEIVPRDQPTTTTEQADIIED